MDVEKRSNAAVPREAWLLRLASELDTKLFGEEMPVYRVTCGWPSRGATSQKKRTIGQCFCPTASTDGTAELIVSMWLDDPMEVAATLAHEMIHAIVGIEAGHKGPFRALALQIGLEGKMTATTAGEAFKQTVQPILDELGPYPHAKLDPKSGPKKQSTRLIKAECGCGYTVRVTRKWLEEVGAPLCPLHGEMAVDQ
ncbi:MAG: SprT-like domain-containing protein [Roseibium sp.]|nr:SprT-like domain-containing protein [Roseibium sp.]